MLRTWKTATVWVMTLLTATSPASACRGRFWGGSAGCYSGCGGYSSYYNVQCAPAACCGEVYGGSDCGSSTPSVSGTYQPAPTDSYPAPAAPAPTPAPAPSYRPTPVPVQPLPADELPPVEPPTARPTTPAPVAPPAPDMPEATPSPLEEALPTEPAAPAAPANDVEDLFKETDTDKTPAAEPADAAPAPGGDVEDLFKDTDDKKAASTEAAPTEPMEPAAPSEVEDLFSEPTDKAEQSVMTESVPAPALTPEEVTPEPVAPAESPVRLWTDNTGKYQVWGRLVTVTSTHVRLLKETGKYTTVPFERLSRSDLAFVRTQSPSVLAGKF